MALVLAVWYVLDISGSQFFVLGEWFDRQVGEGPYVIAVGAVIALVGALQ